MPHTHVYREYPVENLLKLYSSVLLYIHQGVLFVFTVLLVLVLLVYVRTKILSREKCKNPLVVVCCTSILFSEFVALLLLQLLNTSVYFFIVASTTKKISLLALRIL